MGIGGDPFNGTNFVDCLERFVKDPQVSALSQQSAHGCGCLVDVHDAGSCMLAILHVQEHLAFFVFA